MIKYTDHKHLNDNSFMSNLLEHLTLKKLQPKDCEKFKFSVTMLLDSHATMKERCIGCNLKRFRSSEIDKAMIMTLLLKKS